VIVDTNLGEDFLLTEIRIQQAMVGKSLIELALPKRFGVTVVGIRRGSPAKILQPSPGEALHPDDNLIIVSSESAIPKLTKGVQV
jgi:trk system potassium uptake protein TrkA